MDLRRLLQELGYEILERENVWAECLLLRGEEAWAGHGRDREDALRVAVLRALPSYLARKLLERALAGTGDQELPEAASAEAGPEDEHEGDAADEASVTTPQPSALPAISVVPAPAPKASAAPRATVVRMIEIRPPAPPEPVANREELLALLDELDQRIESDSGELALCAPQRQRLVLLAWLARARSCNEAAARDPEIFTRVQATIKKLRTFSEVWWPGMIAAFRIEARPPETHKELRGAIPQPPERWEEVADAAELAVEAMEEEPGRDELGWSDANALWPPAPDPDAVLEELRAAMEAIEPFGPRQPKDVAPPDVEQMLPWIHKLRWIRRGVENTHLWGLVAGRLRFWAMTAGQPASKRAIDPAYRPPRSWAALLKQPDERRKLEAEVAAALEALPPPDASDDVLVGWLVRALPLTSTHARRIEAAAYPLRSRIEAIDAEQIPESDRRIRRRLQKLKSALAAMDAPPPVPAEEGAALAEGEAGATVEDLIPPQPDRVNIPEAVLERTRGKRALFIGNRQDPNLRERLIELLDFAELDWTEATTRRVDASVASITADAYDLVLGATGFLDHKTDDLIRRACKGAGIPYFRVNRGRVLAVVSALSRDLGVSRG